MRMQNILTLLTGGRAGSKLEKARALGVPVIDEATFLGILLGAEAE